MPAITSAPLPSPAAAPAPSTSTAAAGKTAPPPALATAAPEATTSAATAAAPSATVTLSPEALSLSRGGAGSTAAAATTSTSTYDSIKNGISTATCAVGDAISSGAHGLAEGVESALSATHTLAQGIVALPFAAVAKMCDATGAVIDAV